MLDFVNYNILLKHICFLYFEGKILKAIDYHLDSNMLADPN